MNLILLFFCFPKDSETQVSSSVLHHAPFLLPTEVYPAMKNMTVQLVGGSP